MNPQTERPVRLDASDVGEAGVWFLDKYGQEIEIPLTNYELVDLLTPFIHTRTQDLRGSYVKQVKHEVRSVFNEIAVSDSY